MTEHKGDLWQNFGHAGHRVAISTNGTVKRNGHGVMGRGCALQATQLFPDVDLLLGRYLEKHGNVPGWLMLDADSPLPTGDRLVILPVKHNWYEKADLLLVQKSVAWLAAESHAHEDWTFHVPRLGCGNGKLDWAGAVRPIMQVLPDNVLVHH